MDRPALEILRLSQGPGFSIISAEHDPIADRTTLTWESDEGEVFDVHKSLDLDAWVVVEMQIPAAATPPQTTTAIVDNNSVEPRALFYRVVRLAGEEQSVFQKPVASSLVRLPPIQEGV